MPHKKPDSTTQKEWDRIPHHMRGIHHLLMQCCPRIKEHEYGPDGYGDWDNWANKKGKTHTQEKCDCGFFVIWNKKP